jgi:hypothetical protein
MSSMLPVSGMQAMAQRKSLLPEGLLRGSVLRLLGRYLMIVVILEAAVLGSGQLLRLAGGVTAKMLLFVLSMLFVLASLVFGEKLKTSTLVLIFSYIASLTLACLLGLLHGAPLDHMGKDISPILSFLLLPFFELTIRNKKHVAIAVRIILLASVVIVGVYIVIVFSLLTGHVSYADLAMWLGSLGPSSGMGDFLFDVSTERVFYKGSIYLAIALIFFLFQRKSWARIASLFMVLNLIAIGSRGFFLALFLTGFIYVLIGPLRVTTRVALILPVLLAGVILLPKLFLLAGNRTDSNMQRVVTIDQVVERTNILAVFEGHGFGVGVPERPEHMEIVPLEIFYKQGLIGLCWWGIFCGYIVVAFRKSIRHGNPDLAYPFFLSFVFIAIESCTNPYINNPIGMTFVVLALTCLNIRDSDNPIVDIPVSYVLSGPPGDRRENIAVLDSKETAFG